MRKILFIFYLFSLCSTCQSAQIGLAKEEVFDRRTFEETKRAAISVYTSLARAQRDRLAAWNQKSNTLASLSDHALEEVYRMHQHSTAEKTPPLKEQKKTARSFL
jgi:hypothetical protein